MTRWQDIIGHSEIVGNLKRMVLTDSMPHAMLFSGMDGIGKFLTGMVLAEALLCEKNDGPCGECQSCKAIAGGVHPDLFVLEPEGKTIQMIKIEQIRQMQAEISLAPYLSDKRVVLINDADKINETAANGFLKTLEEPVGEIFFILITGNERKILPTILSRCMKVYFSSLSNDDVKQILQAKGIEKDTAQSVARLAGGSVKQALTLYENDGLENRRNAFEFMGQIFSFSEEDIWHMADILSDFTREKLSEWFFYLQMFWRDMIVLYQDNSGRHLYNNDITGELTAQRDKWPLPVIFEAAAYADEVQHRLTTNADIRLITEEFIIKLRDLVRS